MELKLPAAVRVPGSSANLGPGFDVLGLALELYLDVAAREPIAGMPLVACSGPHTGGIAADESNLVLAAWRTGFERAGRVAPPVCVELNNSIPLTRGLGSSGAAAVAGITLANHCGALGFSPMEVIALAAELEQGHPDNVAASCLGGLTIACRGGQDRMQVLALPWPGRLGVVVAVPEFRLETKKAREVLPAAYRRADAVFNLQRVALLAGALASGRPDPAHIATALADRIHQPYRAPLVPGLKEAIELRAPGLLGVALSGAGPSLIAFTDGDPAPAVAALRELYDRLRIPCDVRPVKVAARGAWVLPEGGG